MAGAVAIAAALSLPLPARADPYANPLERELGRAEVRVRSSAFAPLPGTTITGTALPQRLARLGYRRVRVKPERPGEFFWGDAIVWIYRREFRAEGRDHPPVLFGLTVDERRGGTIVGLVDGDRQPLPTRRLANARLEPETLAESLQADRAQRVPVGLEELPERVWRAVLAAEDHRFFEHSGLDARGIARALLANVLAGRVTAGGSTITQQLVKNRDLTPKRTVGRKVSEAVRALALEEAYDKREILETYLNHVYLGHVDNLAVHGIGAAARAYFSKAAAQLSLAEAALLAGVIQSPNRLNPIRHPDAARGRQLAVLQRMEHEGWATASELRAARAQPTPTRPSPVAPAPAAQVLSWIAETVGAQGAGPEPAHGVVVETTIDAELQRYAEAAIAEQLGTLRRGERQSRRPALQAALVALDARDGSVLAYVGGDPATPPGFDRARNARRQPGSAVKPFVLLEAFESCGPRPPLYPAARVADQPLTLELPTGPWRPVNTDARFRGTVTLRTALTQSLNLPFVRLARHCGFEPTAARFRAAGLALPMVAPPSFVLGALETTPLELASAYTVFAAGGEMLPAHAVARIESPGGRELATVARRPVRVASAAAAFLVHDTLRDAVANGTGRPAALPDLPAAGKTGSTTDLRDAWFAGDVGSIVASVWVGLDDNAPLGLSGAAAAAPAWREFMAKAALARPRREITPPRDVVRLAVDSGTGRIVSRPGHSDRFDYFQRDRVPPRRWLFARRPLPVIE